MRIFFRYKGYRKTSTARIFARAVNCSNIQQGNRNSCELCSTPGGQAMDIIEIDAASNRGLMR